MKKLNLFSLVTGIIGALCIVFAVATIVIAVNQPANEGSIGIIGGVDTPTINFIMSCLVGTWQGLCFMLGVPLVLTALFAIIFKKTVSNHCSLKTTITALLISAMVGAEAGCFINCFLIAATGQMHKHPIQYPWSVAGTTVAFVAILGLLALYIFKLRVKNPRGKGIAIDMLTAAVYFPSMFLAFLHFAEWLSWAVNVILS